MESLKIEDVKLLRPRKFLDERGYFSEVYKETIFSDHGIDFKPVQENQSLSRYLATVRGLHFQLPPFAQAKLVRVLRGRIFDIAVDIRKNSPTYRHWVGVELTSEAGEQIFIPKGFAHGFCTLEPDCEIAYLVDAPYDFASDRVISWKDPDLGILWPIAGEPVLSSKDVKAPCLADVTLPNFE